MIRFVMAHSKTLPAQAAPRDTGINQAKLNVGVVGRGKSRSLRRFRSVSHLHLVARHQTNLIRALCCVQSGTSPSAKRCSVKVCLAQMKYQYFVPECCKQNANFSGASHQNRSYLDKILTNRQHNIGFQQGYCSS